MMKKICLMMVAMMLVAVSAAAQTPPTKSALTKRVATLTKRVDACCGPGAAPAQRTQAPRLISALIRLRGRINRMRGDKADLLRKLAEMEKKLRKSEVAIADSDNTVRVVALQHGQADPGRPGLEPASGEAAADGEDEGALALTTPTGGACPLACPPGHYLSYGRKSRTTGRLKTSYAERCRCVPSLQLRVAAAQQLLNPPAPKKTEQEAKLTAALIAASQPKSNRTAAGWAASTAVPALICGAVTGGLMAAFGPKDEVSLENNQVHHTPNGELLGGTTAAAAAFCAGVGAAAYAIATH